MQVEPPSPMLLAGMRDWGLFPSPWPGRAPPLPRSPALPFCGDL